MIPYKTLSVSFKSKNFKQLSIKIILKLKKTYSRIKNFNKAIPAGTLGLPYYSSQRPAYMNFGAVGMVVMLWILIFVQF
jgi:hypothetical protein